MELAAMAAVLSPCETRGALHGELSGLSYNSKTVDFGELFFCLRGKFTDGHAFAAEAVARGAIGLVVEEFVDLPVGQIKVANTRFALLQAGRAFYSNPAGKLGLVGVTGTNGKTTTTFLIRSVLGQAEGPVGLIGTVYNQLGGNSEPSTLTTPESLDLCRLLDGAVAAGCRWVVMEVSSHALAMHRVDVSDLDAAVILNITRDHFEFHGTFEHYLDCKARLVRGLPATRKAGRPRAAVLNADDPHVAALGAELAVPVVTFGMDHPADVFASQISAGARGSEFLLHLPGATPTPVHLPLPGRFNVANALAAAAVGWLFGVPLRSIAEGLTATRFVPGRAELIDEGQPFTVIVDFAHNPDALAKVVSLRPDRPGARSILVFGAEGGKDRGKRPEMGRAARGADYVIITSDNMPKEEPDTVALEVAAGLGGHPHEIVLDRRQAIERAVGMALPGDLVIIAGKGHEQVWVYGGQRIPFDDRAVVRATLRKQTWAEL
ncbi:MAG: UDP-N-acetylmuramyl peptide synthase [Symbiobacteriaceae bacterium]|jgi:UDP-N-acetylmuramoyl-L-alanyl-D-glutamate--2,6-diaminopimelate ligase|nr:UDP-N-acetylmuramyl peptide synthase [Symbiobacteriaceae bacterium]